MACTLVAALLHLFFMAAFSWMLVEGLLLWSKVVAVNLNEDRHMKYYYLIGWGTKNQQENKLNELIWHSGF